MGNNMMLTIAALFLFATFVVSARNLMTSNTRIADRSEYSLTALSLAQSVIDEAKTKAFDNKTAPDSTGTPGSVSSPDSLTSYMSLGPEGGSESVSNPDTLNSTTGQFASIVKFNDVDDYDGYRRSVNTPRARGYRLTVNVYYVDGTSPGSSLTSNTYYKRMDVSVSCPAIALAKDDSINVPVHLSYVFAY